MEATIRTDAEIIAFCKEREGLDWMGTTRGDVLATMTFEAAKPLLKSDATPDDWGEVESREPEAVVGRMREYMSFAWDKALGHRGISASRSIDHYRAWLFLLGDDEMLAFADDDDNYPNYGVPVLAAICEKYGFDVPDDPAVNRMSVGGPCEPGCIEGCG